MPRTVVPSKIRADAPTLRNKSMTAVVPSKRGPHESYAILRSFPLNETSYFVPGSESTSEGPMN